MNKIRKEIHTALFIIGILLYIAVITNTCYAANDSINRATSYTLGTTKTGRITDSQNYYYYKFTIPSSGRVNINTQIHVRNAYIKIYDANKEEVDKWNLWWNSTAELISEEMYTDLTKGTYYFAIEKSSGTGSFQFKLDFISANETFIETGNGSNNTIATANMINVDKTKYFGQIADNDEQDYYKFTLNASGRITLGLTAYVKTLNIVIYDENGQEVYSTDKWWNSTSEQIAYSDCFDLTKGTYYLKFKYYSGTGNYNFNIGYVSANESFVENNGGSNNMLNTASRIQMNTRYRGQIALNDDKDFYKFHVASGRNISINLNGKMKTLRLKIYDNKGDEIWSKDSWWNSTTEEIAFTDNDIYLNKGDYYFCVSDYNGEGNYDFEISNHYKVKKLSFNVSKKTLTMGNSYKLITKFAPSNASDKRVEWKSSSESIAKVSKDGTIKTYRAGVVTITAVSKADGKIEATCKLIVKPKKVNLKKVKKYKGWYSKGFTVTFSECKGAAGYQIIYAKNSKFKKNKKTYAYSSNYSVTGLKKGKYYVKVKAYVWDGNKKIYGAASKVKKVTVK